VAACRLSKGPMTWSSQKRRNPDFHPALVALCILCILFGFAANAQQPQRPCEITVTIRSGDGSPTDIAANVSLYYFAGGSALNVVQPRGGQVVFRNLSPARYSVEVTAGGYQTVTQSVDLQVAGQSELVYVSLTPQSTGQAPSTSSVPVIAPKAQKELTKILEDLRANRTADAQKRLEKVSRTAPSYPDVNYLWGAYYSQTQDRPHAKESWQKALQEDPRHAYALAALAQAASDDRDFPVAIGYLERLVDLQPSSWSYQLRLAAAYMAHQELDRAEKSAIRATELGKEHAADGHLILAQIYAKRKEQEQVIHELEAFLTAAPASPRAPQVRQWIATLRAPATPPTASSSSTSASPTDVSATSLPLAAANVPLLTSNVLPEPNWLPADVDATIPAVEPGVACPMGKIQQETGERVHEFISAVNRITATEYLDNEVMDDSGLPKRRESRRYNYVVAVSRVPTSQLVRVEEYRNGSAGLENFPERVATLGVPAMVLVFDHAFRNDYDMYCEGLSHNHGGSSGLAWQVHFRQKHDQPARLRGYTIGRANYALPLRGRAWIATDSFQVLSMETDIVAPLPAIQLKTEHDIIEYAPVKFSKNNQELWLPASAELFLDFHGHRIHRRHYFRNYLLFSVDENQKISDPKAALDSLPDASQ
jgi:tetratricopeptide (TPR) repeat protein